MKIIGIVQARMDSSRLYGKILHPLKGLPLLALLARRLENAKVDEWWLATTREKEDDLTAYWGKAIGWSVYRGSVKNVLSRFTEIIKNRQPQYVVRITADDPFTDGEIINLMLDQAFIMPPHKKLLSSGRDNKFPLGYTPSIAVADSLVKIESEIPQDQFFHRSHVVSWLEVQKKNANFVPPENWPERSGWRWTVDTAEDAAMAAAAFESFGDNWQSITYPDMVSILDRHPDIPFINAHIKQKQIEEG
mgnify:CR=1 FL=1